MRRLGTALITAALLATTACGSKAGSSADSSASADGKWHGCTASDLHGVGRVVAHADFDQDGRFEEVRYVRPGQALCPGLVSATAHGVMGTDLQGIDVDPSSVRGVGLKGRHPQSLVLVGERPQPRGGVQLHLIGSDGRTVGEVTHAGRPLLPFYATDGGGTPVTATCPRGGGVALVTARTHEPPGIVLAWDVTRTRYYVDGLDAKQLDTAVVQKAAADPTLRKDRPHLFDGSFFAGCDITLAG